MSIRDRLSQIASRVRSDFTIESFIGDRFKAHWSVQSADFPRATFSVITSQPMDTLGGDIASDTFHMTLQISIFAEKKYETVLQIASAMRRRLHGWSEGDIGSMRLTDQTDITNDPQGSDIPIYGIEQDYSVWMEAHNA